MELKAYAKINLSLRVFEKRPDGFHNIESVMQSVSLYDHVSISPSSSGVEVVCGDPKVPTGRENVAYRAAELFLRVRDEARGVRVDIEKNIPVAAGLAGGSADAAAVLFGLNQMVSDDRRLKDQDLIKLGAQVGADVPFCLRGGTCLVRGKGERVEKQEAWPKTYFILVCPAVQVSTEWAYEEYDRMHLNVPEGIKNDLEAVVVSRHEVVAEIKEKLSSLGCSEAQMSGSGPSVFGAVKNRSDAENIFKKVREFFPRSFLVETVGRGIELL